MKILVVEDDRIVVQSLQFLLSSYNYAVDIATDGEEALRLADAFEYHLVLLDVLLPHLSGIDVCRHLRKKGFRQPILLLTGQGETQQKAIALNAGADDYVVKPFDNDELIARIQALLRRGGTAGNPILTWDHLSLDPNTRKVAYRDQLLVLTPKEYAILELFLRQQETVFSARTMLDLAWKSVESPGEEAVRCHIKDLRQKLMAVGAPKDLIKTVYRVGYRLNPLYAASTPVQVDQSLTAPQVAELRSINEELRVAMEQLQATQTELQQRNQELQAARDELEKQVAARTAELQVLYDQAPCGYHLLDAEGRIVQINETELRMFGYAREEMLGRKITDFFTPEGLQTFEENYPKFIQQGWVNDLEFTIIRKDSSRLPVSISGTAIKDEAGNFLMSRSMVLDIRDRKNAEIALSQHEAQMSRILDNAGAAIGEFSVYADRTYVYRFYSVGCETVFGYSQAEMMGDSNLWLSRVLPEDVETVIMPGYEQIFAEKNFTIEYRFQDKTNTIRWISETLTSRWNEAVDCWQVTTIAIDISARKQTTIALQQSEAKFRHFADNSHVVIWIADPTSLNCTYVSPAYEAIWGRSCQSLLDAPRSWLDAIHPDDREQVEATLCQKRQGSTSFVEYRIVRPDGTIRWIQDRGFTVRDEKGQIYSYAGIAEDISDRRQAAAKLRESEQQYRSLFESIDQGFCLLEVVFDANDKAIDYRFMEINQAFEQQSGLINAVGKTILELVPNLEPQWAELYGQVAKSGEAIRFEADVPSMNSIFDIYAFPSGTPGQNLVAVLFANITQRKRAEESLRRTAELDAFRVSLADALNPLTDASEIQAIAARILGESLRATRVVYIEVVSEGEEVIVHCNYTHGVAELSGQYRLEDYRRNLIADHQAGHTLVVTNIPDHPSYTDAEKARYRELEIAAHIDVPLIKNNQFVALLAVHQSTPRQWTETEVKRVEETAERTWAAVERAYSEAALRQNEELLQLALTGAHAGTWDWELATGKLTWSPETYQLYGLDLTASPPNYDDWYENSLHPDDRTWVNHYVNQMITQGQPDLQLEFRMLHPQHGIRWILSLGHLTVNEQGEPIRLSGINLDISDRKQAELSLQKQIQQESLLNDIAQEIRRSLNLNDVLFSTVHRVRAFLEVDRVVIFRFRPDWQGDVIMESVGDEWTPILSTTISDPCFRDHYIEPYRQGRVATMSDIDTADLEPCYVELLQQFQVKANLVVPILQNSHLWGLLIAHHCTAPRQWISTEIALLQRLATKVGIAIQQAELYQQLEHELSDRKQAEQKIREQAALLDISTDAILVCDLDCRILYWNQGAEHLYGWQAEEVLGQTANELLSRSPSTFGKMKQIVLEQGTWHGETQKFTKTGKEVTVEGRCTLVRDEAGQPKSILSVDTDITEKKSLEAQFHQAQRLESLGTLTSGIAHDLNNALTPILTIAQLLRMKQSELDARSREMLQVLEESAQRGANMVKQILTFTRGTGGENSPVDVALLLKEVVKVAQQTFPKSITIRAIVPPEGVRQVSADATQLHQVVMNLCVNARDAMPTGGTLTLSAENFEANEIFAQINLDAHVGQYVLITVADTGTGIAPEVRDRIFDPFFTTKPFGQGTGLGLSTVLGIVRSYRGFIQVASEVGKGTQFKIYLPAVEMESASNLQETILSQGQGELILVVDDESLILQSTCAILETHHYQVLTARNGTEAIALYAQQQQDIALVLVDMMMPDIDGVTVIRVLQEMNPQVRAIAVSGLLPQYQNSLKALGITTLLNKPYTTEDLLNSIHLQLLPEA